jgi:putative heme iron utilization protein
MTAMMCPREEVLLEVPQRVEGVGGGGGSEQADRTVEEVVQWGGVMVVCRKEEDG